MSGVKITTKPYKGHETCKHTVEKKGHGRGILTIGSKHFKHCGKPAVFMVKIENVPPAPTGSVEMPCCEEHASKNVVYSRR